MKQRSFKTTVGGQALLEGIMMKGPKKCALAIRKPDGEIHKEEWDIRESRISKLPFLRGVFVMASTLKLGYSCLMKSAEISLSEEEIAAQKGRVEQYIEKHFKGGVEKIITAFALCAGIGLAILLFMVVPTYLTVLVNSFLPLGSFRGLVEGISKLFMFVTYLALCSRMPDMKRVFSYHGAEHKTIFCYEAGDELTIDNIRRHPRHHPRCGTSFLLIVIIIGILVFSVISWGSPILRIVYKLLLLPVVIGISYEIIRLAGRYNNIFTRLISMPGMWLQNFTTFEPTDDMIEIAIEAVLPVLPREKGEAQW